MYLVLKTYYGWCLNFALSLNTYDAFYLRTGSCYVLQYWPEPHNVGRAGLEFSILLSATMEKV